MMISLFLHVLFCVVCRIFILKLLRTCWWKIDLGFLMYDSRHTEVSKTFKLIDHRLRRFRCIRCSLWIKCLQQIKLSVFYSELVFSTIWSILSATYNRVVRKSFSCTCNGIQGDSSTESYCQAQLCTLLWWNPGTVWHLKILASTT